MLNTFFCWHQPHTLDPITLSVLLDKAIQLNKTHITGQVDNKVFGYFSLHDISDYNSHNYVFLPEEVYTRYALEGSTLSASRILCRTHITQNDYLILTQYFPPIYAKKLQPFFFWAPSYVHFVMTVLISIIHLQNHSDTLCLFKS